ncbi:methyl-accepting chemotaxis protein [Paenibacillus glufosinatiresistens]|uniref:methyl-accepting chemotaxis protein n=1 Tax=Paenibacillus glufosinatiresistens TaxID=3070657 RepID=UPI00286DD83F|nr:HAMP domain-containing methyl-accepting chemotaxis protein [Paenibacillus sp. YX.27]
MKRSFRFKSLKKRILFGFSIVLFVVVLLGGYNYLAIKALNDKNDEVVDHPLSLLMITEKSALNMSQRTSLARGSVLYEDAALRKELDQLSAENIKLEQELLKLNASPEAKQLVEKNAAWEKVLDSVFQAFDAGNEAEAEELLKTQSKPLEIEILKGYTDMASLAESSISDQVEYIQHYGDSSLKVDIGVSVFVIAVGIWVALLMARKISRPVIALKDRVEMMAAGDFSQPALPVATADEIGQLVTALNGMNEGTNGLLNRIHTVSDTVWNHSEQLTQAAGEVKMGTGQIAVTMEEMATAAETQANSASDLSDLMEGFTATVNEANDRGQEVHTYSEKVQDLTEKGSLLMESSSRQMASIHHIVRDAMNQMERLDAKSQEVSKLVSVIKDIAEQTNLLALNAAIEAARAGDQGRGFAVVADQVRKLAEQVAFSVQDITQIVNQMQSESDAASRSLLSGYQEVEQGTAQIHTTGETFNEISDAVREMAAGISGISRSLSDVTESTRKVGGFIEEIASVAEETAAGVQQTAASAEQASSSMEGVAGSSEHLAKLSEELRELVQQFKI